MKWLKNLMIWSKRQRRLELPAEKWQRILDRGVEGLRWQTQIDSVSGPPEEVSEVSQSLETRSQDTASNLHKIMQQMVERGEAILVEEHHLTHPKDPTHALLTEMVEEGMRRALVKYAPGSKLPLGHYQVREIVGVFEEYYGKNQAEKR